MPFFEMQKRLRLNFEPLLNSRYIEAVIIVLAELGVVIFHVVAGRNAQVYFVEFHKTQNLNLLLIVFRNSLGGDAYFLCVHVAII